MSSRLQYAFALLAALSCTGFTCSPPMARIHIDSPYPNKDVVGVIEKWAGHNSFTRLQNSPAFEARCSQCAIWNSPVNASTKIALYWYPISEKQHPIVQISGEKEAREKIAKELEELFASKNIRVKVEYW